MKTLRQEIEKLIEEIKSSTKIKSENIQWDDGWDVCANSIKKDLTDILSRHSEPEPEPTAPSQRERIATVPYQCCPVCNGTGKTVADGFTTSVYDTCKVCNGAMIIPMHIVTNNQFVSLINEVNI